MTQRSISSSRPLLERGISPRAFLGVFAAVLATVACAPSGCTTAGVPEPLTGDAPARGSALASSPGAATFDPFADDAGVAPSASLVDAGPYPAAPAAAKTSAPPGSASAALATPLPPLAAGDELIPLVVPEHRDAIVSVPIGATTSRPILLALHGNYDRPEWQCGVWRDATKGYPFILCPRGVPRGDAPRSQDRWTYGRADQVRREIDAGLAALRVRFGDYVAPGPILYVGFSLGAILGVGIVTADPDRYPRAILIEGGHSGWSAARAKSFATAGGKRVLFACGQKSCRTDATGSERLLGRAGVEAKSVYGGEVGHTYDGPVAAEIARALPWIVGDDPRWAE